MSTEVDQQISEGNRLVGNRGTHLRDSVDVDGYRVRDFRRNERRLSQENVANTIGVSRGYISIIENKSPVRMNRLRAERLAATLGKSLVDLQPRMEDSNGPLISSGAPTNASRLESRIDTAISAMVILEGKIDLLTGQINRLTNLLANSNVELHGRFIIQNEE